MVETTNAHDANETLPKFSYFTQGLYHIFKRMGHLNLIQMYRSVLLPGQSGPALAPIRGAVETISWSGSAGKFHSVCSAMQNIIEFHKC